MTDDTYQMLRNALDAGPTPGPWNAIPQHGAGPMIARQYITGNQLRPVGLRLICHILQRGDSLPMDEANAAYISAAHPDTIRALLAERDRLREALEVAKSGLLWYQNAYPDGVNGCDDEAMEQIDNALTSSEQAWTPN